jgi:hypothetical protein
MPKWINIIQHYKNSDTHSFHLTETQFNTQAASRWTGDLTWPERHGASGSGLRCRVCYTARTGNWISRQMPWQLWVAWNVFKAISCSDLQTAVWTKGSRVGERTKVSPTCQQSSPAVDWQWNSLLIVLVLLPDETHYLLSTRHAHLQQSVCKHMVKLQVEYA